MIDNIQRGIIEDFGLGYVKFGYSELMGRIVGLLISEVGPISIDEICKALKVTKTPVNQICRRLEDLNLIKRIRLSGERKYYYEVSPDVFLQASINLSRLIEDNLQISENHLPPLLQEYNAATGDEKERLKVVCERMIKMREYYIRLVQSYQRFISEWRSVKNSLPSVEEYADKIDISAA